MSANVCYSRREKGYVFLIHNNVFIDTRRLLLRVVRSVGHHTTSRGRRGTRDVYADFNNLTLGIVADALFGADVRVGRDASCELGLTHGSKGVRCQPVKMICNSKFVSRFQACLSSSTLCAAPPSRGAEREKSTAPSPRRSSSSAKGGVNENVPLVDSFTRAPQL